MCIRDSFRKGGDEAAMNELFEPSTSKKHARDDGESDTEGGPSAKKRKKSGGGASRTASPIPEMVEDAEMADPLAYVPWDKL